MRLVSVVTAVAAVLLCTHHASAFSMNSSTDTAPDSSSLVDPDEQVRSMTGGKDVDSDHLGYDANSHHSKRPAQDIINGQGVLIPQGSFTSTAPSGR